jgi:endoribonuclease Dicer
MLMRYINTLPAKDDVHRITVFLVPTVALVDQQSDAIAKNTSLRVRPYRGDMREFRISLIMSTLPHFIYFVEVEFWDRKRWQTEFESSDCVVMTAQIWLDVLLHAYWTIDKVRIAVRFVVVTLIPLIGSSNGLCKETTYRRAAVIDSL